LVSGSSAQPPAAPGPPFIDAENSAELAYFLRFPGRLLQRVWQTLWKRESKKISTGR
jgi:hypothetical protein